MKKLVDSKFENLLEAALGRYQLGGYLQGEVVKLKRDALKHPYFVDRGQTFKDMVTSLIERDQILRVSSIKSIRPDVSGIQHRSSPDDIYLDVFEEHAPGLTYNIMTVPSACVEKVDYGINLPPTGGVKKQNRVENLHPIDKSEHSLPTGNTKLPNANAWPSQPGSRAPQKY